VTKLVRSLTKPIPDYVMSVVDGLLLSDMSVDKPNMHKDGKAKCTRLSMQMKYLDVPLFMKNLMSLIGIDSKIDNIYQRHSGTNKIYEKYGFRTLRYTDLLSLRKRWYKGSKKFVPKDLQLSPTCVYFWMLGDGHNVPGRRQIKMATQGFARFSKIRLQKKLSGITGRGSTMIDAQGRIIIRSRGYDLFTEFCASSGLEFKNYMYKFE